MIVEDLIVLLNRGAAAIETPGDLNKEELSQVAEDLAAAAYELEKNKPIGAEHLVESLDGMWPDDLVELNKKYNNLAHGFSLLGEYAYFKAEAMKHRVNGRQEAYALESQCDSIYQQLPKWARW